MFFILRAAFWLSLVVLLLPADESADGQVAQVSTGEAITVAQTFVSDVTGFCARNPQACETGQSVLRTFGSKAQYGAKLVYGYLGEVTGADGEVAQRNVATTSVRIEPTATIPQVIYSQPIPQTGPAPSAVATHTGSIAYNE